MAREKGVSTVLGLWICIGLVGGAFVLGRSVEQIRQGERFVTVKGVAERDVKADFAVWPMKVRLAGNDLAELGQSLDATRAKVVQFLSGKGFTSDEITNQGLRVADRQASDYGQGNLKDLLRYVVETTIVVRSKNVDRVQQVSQMTDELVRAGVVLSSANDWQSPAPRFIFTQLNSIKPTMLAEATGNARSAAKQFAADSGSTVGAIGRASQGLFSITDRDQTTPGQSEGSGSSVGAESDPNKRVRVVVTIDYFLEK